MRLKKHIVDSIAKVEDKARLRKLIGSRDKWNEVVDVFFNHVENRYLYELINDGFLTTTRLNRIALGSKSRANSELIISFASTKIRFVPMFVPTETSLGVIDVVVNPNVEKEAYFMCDLTHGWMAPAREKGLRKAMIRYLPEKLTTLDESLFSDILYELLAVREPMFTYDREKVLRRISHVLDDILDPSRKDRISRFIEKVKSLPITEEIRSLGDAIKPSNLLRLNHVRHDAPRMIAQYNKAEVEDQRLILDMPPLRSV